MAIVGIRELKQQASQVVARVAAGESTIITDRGRPVARMVPLAETTQAQLLESGDMRPPRRPLVALSPTPRRRSSTQPLSAVLAEMRAAEAR